MYGKKNKWGRHTQKTKDQISEKHKGMKKPWVSERNKRKSIREIVSKTHKGKIPWNKGISPSLEVRNKMSKAQKGIPRLYARGQKRSKETRENISKSLKGKPRPYTAELHKDPEFKKKILKGLLKRPTKPEIRLNELIKLLKLPYRYVGNGDIIIKKFNPDFINCNGQKKIIEMFGDYWHNREDTKLRDIERLKTYSEYGYKTLIVWQRELEDILTLTNKLKEFEGDPNS